MKPVDKSYVNNALKHGVAGINIAGTRVGSELRVNQRAGNKPGGNSLNMSVVGMPDDHPARLAEGRWPANILLDEGAAALLDAQSGQSKAMSGMRGKYGGSPVYNAGGGVDSLRGHDDSGGASRFFYTEKSSTVERGGDKKPATNLFGEEITVRNEHPTVKPLRLNEYLATLILPPAGKHPRRLLVPFSGSGSEMVAALAAGWDEVVGVELESEYRNVALRRLRRQFGPIKRG
jgi:site-specific DNA-methyltransferase (adenine-specific)